MKRADYLAQEGLMVSTVSVPPKHSTSPVARHDLVLGFDTEFVGSPTRLLSVQFAAYVAEQLVSQVYPRLDGSLLTTSDLSLSVIDFIGRMRVPVLPDKSGVCHVSLVAHFAAAELGIIQDAIRDANILNVGRAHHAVLPIFMAPDGSRWKIEIVDLFAFFKTSLKTLGEYVGLPKLDIDVENIEQVMLSDWPRFEAYAKRDAEIALAAFSHFRYAVWSKWGVDPLFRKPTLAAVAGEIFKTKFFKVAPSRYSTATETYSRKNRRGEWVEGRRTIHTFAGDRDCRIDAIHSMAGGRNEAFIVGLYDRPVAERDVVSMYPASALLVPLPDHKTKWRVVKSIDLIRTMEGFGRFRFRFPPETQFPCLPVRTGNDQLFFTIAGESDCTFAEVRGALGLGAEIQIVSAHGFEPTERERDNDVARFVRALWAEKQSAKKGTLQYAVAKELLNSALGKFGQRTVPSTLLYFEQQARRRGFSGTADFFAANPSLRDALHAAPSIGSLWSPERYSLITGKARALIAEIICVSDALHVSTDAVISEASSFDCSAVSELRSVGSDLALEKVADAVFIAHARMYALLVRADNIGPDTRVIARDARWGVVKAARQGTPEKEKDFAETILASLSEGKNAAPARQIKKLLGAEEAVRLGKRINDEITIERTTNLEKWDSKRSIVDRDVNIFRSYSATRPYLTEAKRAGAAHAVLVRKGQARRRASVITERKRVRISELAATGMSIREIAKAVRAPKSTVADIISRASSTTTSPGGAR